LPAANEVKLYREDIILGRRRSKPSHLTSSSSTSVRERHRKRKLACLWTCEGCGDSGMSSFIDSCPICGEKRTESCGLYSVRRCSTRVSRSPSPSPYPIPPMIQNEWKTPQTNLTQSLITGEPDIPSTCSPSQLFMYVLDPNLFSNAEF
jgi:hypothetical protein